ncbi:MAG: RNA polymerase sigma factor [Saprospiraceae bacterium]
MQRSQFLQAFNVNSLYLKRFAYNLTKDKSAADDLFQETALNAFRHRKGYRPNTNFKAWLSTIMKNVFINQYRKNKRRRALQDNTPEDYFLNRAGGATDNEGEMNMNMEEVLKLINSLEESYRTPFLMAYQGYKYDEIQQAMNLPLGTIKSKIHYARKILKDQVNALHDEVAA